MQKPIFNHAIFKIMSRLSGGSVKDKSPRARYIKSPEKIETSFSMSTIEEDENEQENLSMKNLNQFNGNCSQDDEDHD